MTGKGIIAGFIATIALSALMVLKAAMGLMPAFNAIKDWVTIASNFGLPANPAVGWILHFMLGAIAWGILYSIIQPKLPGNAVVSGILFGVIAWIGMMLVFMPLAGHGLFALKIGPMVTIATLVLHIVYGAVLGFVYGKLTDVSVTA